jgi:hypothetical protein
VVEAQHQDKEKHLVVVKKELAHVVVIQDVMGMKADK